MTEERKPKYKIGDDAYYIDSNSVTAGKSLKATRVVIMGINETEYRSYNVFSGYECPSTPFERQLFTEEEALEEFKKWIVRAHDL